MVSNVDDDATDVLVDRWRCDRCRRGVPPATAATPASRSPSSSATRRTSSPPPHARVRRRPAALLVAGEHRAVEVQHRLLRGLPRPHGRRRGAGRDRVPAQRLPVHRARPSPSPCCDSNYETQRQLGCNVVWLDPEGSNTASRRCRRRPRRGGALTGRRLARPVRRADGVAEEGAIALGATFVADEVVGLDVQGHDVTAARLAVRAAVVAAGQVVNAAGAWAKDVCAMVGVEVPIEPISRYEHYFECQEEIEPLPYLKDTQRLAFRPEGTGYSGGVPTLAEPRGVNFAVDRNYFEDVVWPALAHRFPQFERTKCLRTLPGLYDQNDFDGNVDHRPGRRTRQLPPARRFLRPRPHARPRLRPRHGRAPADRRLRDHRPDPLRLAAHRRRCATARARHHLSVTDHMAPSHENSAGVRLPRRRLRARRLHRSPPAWPRTRAVRVLLVEAGGPGRGLLLTMPAALPYTYQRTEHPVGLPVRARAAPGRAAPSTRSPARSSVAPRRSTP